MEAKRVTIHQAYVWDCPECGHANFERAIKAEFNRDEKENIYRALHEMEPWQELPDDWDHMYFVTSPDEVQCRDCGEWFRTLDSRIGETNDPLDE